MKSVLKEEQNVGLETFYTETKGIGGKLRSIPEDFIVEERFSNPKHDEKGPFCIATITSKNWETNQLVRTLGKNLQVSRKRIHFAGTKDKRAVSTQLFSFYDIPLEKIQQLSIKDVTISDIYLSSEKLFLGNLKGNHFNICIRNVSSEKTEQKLKDIITPLQDIGGFPNFFGIQRFGIIRPITHLVGKKIVQDDFEGAVMTYLIFLDEHEDTQAYQKRLMLKETNDFKEAFHSFPSYLNYEKAMLNYLQVHPDDFVGALKELPKNLITMFVYAYQSYLFNKMLSQRIKKDLPFDHAVIGDTVIEIKDEKNTENYFQVNSFNIDKVNKQIKRGKAVVSSVLIGANTEFSNGEMGEIEESVFEKESIDKRDFIIPKLPLASSMGTRRGVYTPLENVSYQIKNDSLNPEMMQVRLKFDLRKGCYATSFLREIMKASDIRNY